jgi:hypothetical protein
VSGLKQDMWGEAIHMAMMLYNHTPSMGKSLSELFSGDKPDLMHVHQFRAPV